MSGISDASAMAYENLLVEVRNRIARVTINRPQVLNALNEKTTRELRAAFAALRHDPAVGIVIVTGAGEKAFVAGADINELAVMTPLQAEGVSRLGQATLREIETLGKPVIAAVNGFALGGGCELAMACHLRVASSNARFGQPEVKLGLIPGYGGTQRLPRLVGMGRALEMLLAGGMIDASTAHAWGLVNKVVEPSELRAAVQKLAGEILAAAPTAVAGCLRAVRLGLELPLAQALEHEAALFGLCFATEDMKEGTSAFKEKRKAAFKGK